MAVHVLPSPPIVAPRDGAADEHHGKWGIVCFDAPLPARDPKSRGRGCPIHLDGSDLLSMLSASLHQSVVILLSENVGKDTSSVDECQSPKVTNSGQDRVRCDRRAILRAGNHETCM